MQSINEIKQEIAEIFYPIIGEFRLKTYFSYYAIFKNKSMFALYRNGATYLRIAPKDTHFIKQHPDTYTLVDEKIGLHSKKFHYIPSSILFDIPLSTKLVTATLTNLHQEQQEIYKKRSTQIRNLPNMNIKLERMLKKIGIHSIQEFSNVGYMSTFIKLITQGIDATEDLLFKLNGALNRQYIYTFTETQKREIMQEANQALYESGLRKRFLIDT